MAASKTSTEAVDQKDFLEGPGQVTEHVEITQAVTWTAEEEKKLVRKIDMFLLPNIWLMYLLSYMDRTNIGNAKIAGMADDLKLTSSQYSIILVVFFGKVLARHSRTNQLTLSVGYVIFEPPSNMILVRTRPSLYLPAIMIIWGVLTCIMSVVQSYHHLIILRVFVGVMESGFAPGILLIFSSWYKRTEQSKRFAVFMSAAILSGAFGGLLAGAITGGLEGAHGIRGWRWLFIVEGVATIGWAIIAAFLLLDFPVNTKHLTDRERAIAIARLQEDSVTVRGQGENVGKIQSLVLALRDWRTWGFIFGYMVIVGSSTLSYFYPTLVHGLGYSSTVQAQYMTVPIYAVAFVCTAISGYFADRISNYRGLIIAGWLSFSMITSIAVCVVYNFTARYALLVLMAAGLWASNAISLSFAASTFGSMDAEVRAVALALMNALGNLAQIYGAYLFPSDDAPKYLMGFGVISGMLGFGAAMPSKFCLEMLNIFRTGKNQQKWDPLIPLQRKEAQKPRLSWLGLSLDLLLILCIITFIVFAHLAITSNGHILTEDSRAQFLLNVTFYGPTIFPILFAAIVGRALKALATWELQKGSTIGHVETLSGSTTLIGAIITQIQLRNLNLVAISLVVLWALSPVGGQASLRVLRQGTRVTKTNHQFYALDPMSSWEAGSSNHYPMLTHTLFASSLIASRKLYNKPQDIWGNLRIPMVEAFDNYQDHRWIKIPDNDTGITFSSLIGIPFDRELPVEQTSFTLNTSYMYLDCPTFHTSPREHEQPPIEGYKAPSWTNFTADPPSLENPDNTWLHYHKFVGDDGSIVANGFQITMASCDWGCSQWFKPREARRVIWESASAKTFAHIDCTLHTTYVDVKYDCLDGSCSPIEVRLSPNKPDPSHFSNLFSSDGKPHDPWNTRNFTGFEKGYSNIPSNFLIAMTSAFRMNSVRALVPLLGFILSPNDTTAIPPDGVFYEDVTSIGRAKFQERLSQLFNTLFLAGIEPSVIVGTMPVTEKEQYFATSTHTAETRLSENILVCNKAWFTTMLIICLIVFVISLSGAILRAITLVPDALGTLSIITLDNRCEKDLQKASMLDGLERSRLLKNVTIKLGNVRQDSPSGRVGFTAPANNEDVVQLHWNTYYE
ncbi:unnamed protein product [Fusarium fujikuroi]|nr:unnamed protein product [Fusarium fujikuroi]